MSIGDFARGMTTSLADYLTDERAAQRKREDLQIDEQRELINALIQSPDINPNILGRALTDLANLSTAKAGKRTMKKGNEGFTGATELPISQLLSGISSGMTPIRGRTTETVKTPKELGLMGNAEPLPQPLMGLETGQPAQINGQTAYPGQSVLEDPVMLPPPPIEGPAHMQRMLGAARDVQKYGMGGQKPVANQPLYRDPHETGMEQASVKSEMATYLANAEMERKLKLIKQYLPNEMDQQDAIAQTLGVAPKFQGQPQWYEYNDPSTGETKTGLAMIRNGRMVDASTGLPVPEGAQKQMAEKYMSLDQLGAWGLQNDPLIAGSAADLYRRMHPGAAGGGIPRDPVTGLTGAQGLSGTNTISAQYMQSRQPIIIMETAVGGINEAMAMIANQDQNRVLDTRAPADFLIITNFNKAMDPNSVVREGEFDRSLHGQPFMDRLRGFAGRISQGGTGLTIKELQEYARMANVVLNTAKQRYQKNIAGAFYKRAIDYKLDPSHFMTQEDIAFAQQNPRTSAAIPPPPGTSAMPSPGGPPGSTIPTNQPAMRRPIPGTDQFAVSTDGGRTWKAE